MRDGLNQVQLNEMATPLTEEYVEPWDESEWAWRTVRWTLPRLQAESSAISFSSHPADLCRRRGRVTLHFNVMIGDDFWRVHAEIAAAGA